MAIGSGSNEVSRLAENTPTVQKQDELEALRRENEELVTKLKYLQAEFENYRKRVDRDAETVVKFAHEVLLARLLPVVDELETAARTLEGPAAQGVRMVLDNFLKVLREVNLTEIPAEGLPFDPYVMEAVQQVPDAGRKDGEVKEVIRKGYRLHDRVLRPVQVTVIKNRGEPNG
ncbi:MAG: nucleotide exchange factor GrpE [Thermoplasmata archaeon]|nr:nucleotide exchange factor GrpE [Thermoplasmata archaeon]